MVDAPRGFSDGGVWIRDPHGMLIQLVDCPADSELPIGLPFQINGPGSLVRKGRSGQLPQSRSAIVKPLRLGHVLVFTPDVMRSVEFFTNALGMGLADRAQDVIAFCCAKQDSDHHVVGIREISRCWFSSRELSSQRSGRSRSRRPGVGNSHRPR